MTAQILSVVFRVGTVCLWHFKQIFMTLFFLDIEMAGTNGLTVGSRLMECGVKPIIIFTTQSLNYAVRGYGIALRYLIKPIDYETFAGIMRVVLDKVLPQKMLVTYRGEQRLIPINEISYFEVIRHNVIFHLNNRETVSIRGSLAEIKEQLSRGWFVQTHKSYCVNMDYIDRATRCELTLTNGECVPVGRNRSESFQAQLQEYLKGNTLL